MDSSKKKRAYKKSEIAMGLGVRRYFEKEKNNPGKFDPGQVIKRAAAATGISLGTINKIRAESDAENWTEMKGNLLTYNTNLTVPANHSSLIRMIVRKIFLAKTRVPTIDTIFDKAKQLKVRDVSNLNIL